MRAYPGLRGLLAYLWKHRVYSGLGLLCLLLADAALMIVPLLTQTVIDALVAGTATSGLLMRQAGLVFGMAVITYGTRYGWRYFMFTAARLAETELRDQMFKHALRLNAEYHAKTRSGEVMALATNDVSSVRMALAFGLMSAFDSVAYLLMGIACMFWLDWKLALWTLLPFPLLAFLMRVVMDRIYKTWDRVQQAFEDFNEKSRETIAGMRVLRAYNQHDGDVNDFIRYTDDLYKKYMINVRWDGLYSPSILMLSGASIAILLSVGGSHVIYGVTTLGAFAAFTSYLGQLTWPMIAIGWTVSLVQRGAASMKRILDFLEREPEPLQPDLAVEPKGEIEIKNLTFSYPEAEQPALNGVSLSLRPGGSIGLVGEVGSGKSTLGQLLLRLYDPPRGTIMIDGHDILDYNLRQLRERISWVSQEAFLFSESIQSNLEIGDEKGDFMAASKLAALHKEVMEFPQGYDTLLGERGVTLSGGQKQRLCLARALLKQAPVLILDDTLSAVDSETEHQILDSLQERIRQTQTTLVISHRISSVKDLDQILVLERGRVIQNGTHAELLKRDGLYRQLYELQSAEEECLKTTP